MPHHAMLRAGHTVAGPRLAPPTAQRGDGLTYTGQDPQMDFLMAEAGEAFRTQGWLSVDQVVDDAERQLEEDRMTFQQQLRDDQVRVRVRLRVRLRVRCLTLP